MRKLLLQYTIKTGAAPLVLLFVTFLPLYAWAQAVLENPSPGSFQSGVGVISGWVCDAEQIDIVFNPGTATEETWRAGYRTTREDTAYTQEGEVICGDTDNGFGLLFNWNRLDDGIHTVQAQADGEVFGTATFTVTTLGEDFKMNVSGKFVVEDFPAEGSDITLVWQESLQNFVIRGDMRSSGGTSGTPPQILENPQPGSFQSGVGVISGWVCDAEQIDIVFNPGTATEETWRAGYRTTREDTAYTQEGAVICGDTDNGFGLLFNWNRLDDGIHTVSARADGVEFGSATFTVTTLGEEFKRDIGKRARLKDFPDTGTDLVVAWQQSLQNFVIIGAAPVEPPQYADPARVTGPLGRNEYGEPFAGSAPTPGDVNGDGHEDVVLQLWAGDLTAPRPPSPLVILVNDGAGNLVDGTTTVIAGPIPEVSFVRGFIIEDFNGDGQNDIFMSNHGREDTFDGEQNRLLLSGPDGRLRDVSAQNLPQIVDFSHGSSAADVDGDGDIDLWVNNYALGRDPSYLMLNDGSGAFRIVADLGPMAYGKPGASFVGPNGRLPDALVGWSPLWAHFIDAENDGDADLYLGRIDLRIGDEPIADESQLGRIEMLLNDGTGRFTLASADAIPPPQIGSIWTTQDSIHADLNQDGLHDLLLYQSDHTFLRGHFVQVLISNGDGTFRDETALRLPAQVRAFQGYGPHRLWFRDINGDGHNEILIFLYRDGDPDFSYWTYSYLNMGNGVFTSLPDDFVDVHPTGAPVDVNGDGWVDFLDVKYYAPLWEAEFALTKAINPNSQP